MMVGVLAVASVAVNFAYISRGSLQYVPIRAVDRKVTIACAKCGHVQKDHLPSVQLRLLRGFSPYDFRVKCEKCGAPAKVSGVYGEGSEKADVNTTMQGASDEGK